MNLIHAYHRYAFAVIVAVLLIVLGSCALSADLSEARAIRCQEDSPCFSWSTMGNHKRGVVTMAGNRRVVGPCQFERLVREGWIDLTGQRMRGDAFALRHGCREAHFDALDRAGY